MIHMEYTGPITELQGKTALIRELGPISGSVLAQFDDMDLTFNDQRMGYGWHPFMEHHFTPIGDKPVF